MNLRVGTRLLPLLLALAGISIQGCKSRPEKPNLNDTINFMQAALAEHNGQRIEQPPLSPEVQLRTRLTLDHCKLTYEVSQWDMVQYDLSDIDTRTITVKQIANTWWAEFNEQDFHKSVHYIIKKPPEMDYWANNGGFSLDSETIAVSFSKALTHAAELCGAKPSTF